MRFVSLLIGALLFAGCTQVKPWEKGVLAKESMRFDRPNRHLDHVYFSKEGTHLGGSQGAGGCGCN